MILCPSADTPTHVKRDVATRVAYRHQMAALVLCLCIANDVLKLVQCGVVKPHDIGGRQATAAEHIAMETTQKYITGDLVDGATVQAPMSNLEVFQNVKNSQRRTVTIYTSRETAVKVLCRIVYYKLNSAQQERVFRSRLFHRCVQWKYNSVSQEVRNKLLQRRTFHPNTSAGTDTSISVKWRNYSGSRGGKQQKLGYKQTRNARSFLQHTRSRGRSKRMADMEEPATLATDTYDSRGITLTPRTFYTFYNKSAAKFTQGKQLFPVKITMPTNSPPSPPMLRTSGLMEWKTVSLKKMKTHSNSTPPGDTIDGRSFITSIQSPVSVVTTKDVEETTTPLSVVEYKTSAVTGNWITDRITTETSTVTSTASPPDDSTHNKVSTTMQTITEAELVATLDPQNSTNSFRMQNATTETVKDVSTTPVLPNVTTGGTTVISSTQSGTPRKDSTSTATTFDNYTPTTNQTQDITFDDNTNISSSSSPALITTTIATTKQTTTTTTSTTTATTHEATAVTTKTSYTTTTPVTGHTMTTATTTAQQHIRSTAITSTTTQFPSATTKTAKNMTSASRDHLSSTTIAGITTGSLAIFWLFLGPLVCLICHLKDREKNQRKRQKEDELGHKLVNELIRSELAKGRGKLYKTEVKDDQELEPLPPGTNGTGPLGPVCVTVV